MKTAYRNPWLAVIRTAFLLALTSAIPFASAQQGYQVGQVVTTNFALVNRYLWTNDTGQVFTPSNTVLRLSDFDGKIVFFELFAVW
jgi:hypothetical protein